MYNLVWTERHLVDHMNSPVGKGESLITQYMVDMKVAVGSGRW
jgi:hypothetical protein